MTRSVYMLGGAGTGKSTFMAQLLQRLSVTLGPLEDLHARMGGHGRAVTLRGHQMDGEAISGYYLGVMRAGLFPGTDALERVSHGPATEWVRQGQLPAAIVSEGATLAVRPFLYALQECTELLTLAFHCEPWLHELRLLQRGTGQADSFIASSVTRTNNMVRDLEKKGGQVLWVDSGDGASWEHAQATAAAHLQNLL